MRFSKNTKISVDVKIVEDQISNDLRKITAQINSSDLSTSITKSYPLRTTKDQIINDIKKIVESTLIDMKKQPLSLVGMNFKVTI